MSNSLNEEEDEEVYFLNDLHKDKPSGDTYDRSDVVIPKDLIQQDLGDHGNHGAAPAQSADSDAVAGNTKDSVAQVTVGLGNLCLSDTAKSFSNESTSQMFQCSPGDGGGYLVSKNPESDDDDDDEDEEDDVRRSSEENKASFQDDDYASSSVDPLEREGENGFGNITFQKKIFPDIIANAEALDTKSKEYQPNISFVKGHLFDMKEQVDVLVNPITPDLNLQHFKLSRSLCNIGGDRIFDEMKEKYPFRIRKDIVARTTGGNLNCKVIYHIVVPQWQGGMDTEEVELNKILKTCLQMACSEEFQSIAFPVLGAEEHGFPVDLVRGLFISLAMEFSERLKIIVVINEFYKAHVKAFEDIGKYNLFGKYLPEEKIFYPLPGACNTLYDVSTSSATSASSSENEQDFSHTREDTYSEKNEDDKKVYFDLETTGLGADPHILQLAALSSEKSFSNFVFPQKEIDQGAFKVHRISHNKERIEMTSHGKRVNAVSIRQCLNDFLEFIGKKCVLIGFNSQRFDCRVLMNALFATNMVEDFESREICFLDAFPLMKICCPGLRSYKQPDLYEHFFEETYCAHDAFEDVTALKRIFEKVNPSIELQKYHKVSFEDYKNSYQKRREEMERPLTQSLSQLKKVVSPHMLEKMRQTGLRFSDIEDAYKHDTETGVRKLFTELNEEGKPRLTKKTDVFQKVNEYFNSKSLNGEGKAETKIEVPSILSPNFLQSLKDKQVPSGSENMRCLIFVENLNPKTSKDCLTHYMEAASPENVKRILQGPDTTKAIVEFEGEPDFEKILQRCQKKKLEKMTIHIDNAPCLKSLRVTNLQAHMNEEYLELLFENPKKSGGGEVEKVDYDLENAQAVVYFKHAEDADRVLNKKEIMVNEHCLFVEPFFPQIHTLQRTGKKKKIKNNDTLSAKKEGDGSGKDLLGSVRKLSKKDNKNAYDQSEANKDTPRSSSDNNSPKDVQKSTKPKVKSEVSPEPVAADTKPDWSVMTPDGSSHRYGGGAETVLQPFSCVINVNPSICRFLLSNKAVGNEIQSLCTQFCAAWEGNMEQSFIKLTRTMTDANMPDLIWSANVQRAFQEYFYGFCFEEFFIKEEFWLYLIDKLQNINLKNPDDGVVTVDHGRKTVSLTGRRHFVKELMGILESCYQDIKNRYSQPTTVSETLSSYQLQLLWRFRFKDEMSRKYQDRLSVEIDIDKREVRFTGCEADISSAKIDMSVKLTSFETFTFSLSGLKKALFFKSAVRTAIQVKLRSVRIQAVWEINANNECIVYALTKQMAKDAADIISKCLAVHRMEFQDLEKVVRTTSWQKMIKDLTVNDDVIINIVEKGIEIAALDSQIERVKTLCQNEIDEFTRINAVFEKSFSVGFYEGKFLLKFRAKELNDIESSLMKLNVKWTNMMGVSKDPRLVFKGTKDGVSLSEKKVAKLVSAIQIFKHTEYFVGIRHFFTSASGRFKLDQIENQHSCLISLTNWHRAQHEYNKERPRHSHFDKNGQKPSKSHFSSRHGDHDDDDNDDDDGSNPMSDDDSSDNDSDSDRGACGGYKKTDKRKSLQNLTTEIVKGDITCVQADILVNTTSSKLILDSGAISKTILTKAGNGIQEEAKRRYPDGIDYGQIALTSGGNLKNCQYIFHGCFPKWSDVNCPEILETFITKSLLIAEKNHLKSIAFPVIGSGMLNYPPSKVAEIMFGCVQRHDKKALSLKHVIFVIYPKDTEAILKFEAVIGKKAISDSSSTMPKKRSNSTPGSKKTENLGSLHVVIKEGNITQVKVDAIVNSTSSKLDLSKGELSKSILEAGGKQIQSEIKGKVREMEEKDAVITSAGDLPCKKIIHLNATNDIQTWKNLISMSLQMADKECFKSVAFPAIGTGARGCNPVDMARVMFSAFGEFKGRHLQEIRLVLPTELVQTYRTELDTFVGKGSGGSRQRSSRFSSSLDSNSRRHSSNSGGRADENLIDFWIMYDKEENKSGAKQRIKDIIRAEFTEKECRQKIPKEIVTEITDFAKRHHVKLSLHHEKYSLSGQQTAVSSVSDEILSKILAYSQKQNDITTAESISAYVQWYYYDDTSTSNKFSPKANAEIEIAYKKKQKQVKVKDYSGNSYFVNLEDMTEYDVKYPQKKFQIERKPLLSDKSLPSNWVPLATGELVKLVTLQPTDPEYQRVALAFTSTGGLNSGCFRVNHSAMYGQANVYQSSYPIRQIQRVQNVTLYDQFMAKKHEITTKNGGKDPEKWLFHGTASQNVDKIVNNGFNRSFGGGGSYGAGVYFAVNASYSLSYCKGGRQMFYSRVLTGDVCRGQGGMKHLPIKNANQHYDSACDNPINPVMYIIFHDSQAYPEYLITF